MLDVFFDLGYVLTYLVMVVIGATELHLNVSVWGNFGERSQLGFSNSTLPRIWCCYHSLSGPSGGWSWFRVLQNVS